ncbi:coordinator of PRMT5 and differentiation stimulator-like isoform X1 [Narcine bancroftii]|uniref:coordinator of PRMT5 and differentiation stimulator-like isoform X1 n=1 Tax=Narcine bancroftii TaxID=1343680 RepID=UPI00383213E6
MEPGPRGVEALLDAASDALGKISLKDNTGLSQELQEWHVTSVCQKNEKCTWRPRLNDDGSMERAARGNVKGWISFQVYELKDQAMKEQDGTLDSDSPYFEKQSISPSRGEDDDYSDDDPSDYDVSSPPEMTQLSGMDVELFSEKEDWEKELNEACPYDEDDLEIIKQKSYYEGTLVWQGSEIYNPSLVHAPSFRANTVDIPIVKGQFDDADE